MQIVIDIPEKMYHMINAGLYDYGDMNLIIQNGTPLPKGHDRLIEAKRLKEVFRRNTGYDYRDLIDIAPTIIEADNAESEGEYGDV